MSRSTLLDERGRHRSGRCCRRWCRCKPDGVARPLADPFGTATINITADDGTSTTTRPFVLTVGPVNDEPSFQLAPDPTEVAGTPIQRTIPGFLRKFIARPRESTQTLASVELIETSDVAAVVQQASLAVDGTLTSRSQGSAAEQSSSCAFGMTAARPMVVLTFRHGPILHSGRERRRNIREFVRATRGHGDLASRPTGRRKHHVGRPPPIPAQAS
jgi:hypothetical protein